jgi:hypothetical protein
VETVARRISRSQQAYQRKLKDAVHILFFTHHKLPGVRGWELRKELGSDWQNILEVLDKQLQPFDLKVTRVLDEPDILEPTKTQLQDARYYITMRGTVNQKTAKTIGWRIDDIAGLAVSVAYIISKQGKAMRQDVERVLEEKLPGWRVRLNIDRYIQQGYLGEDEQGILFLDWRARAEVDTKKLVDLVLSYGKKEQAVNIYHK